MVAGYHGLDIDLITLRRQFQASLRGVTLKQLMEIAEELGFSARPVRCEIEDVGHLALPVILHWSFNHFVVLTRIARGLNGEPVYHIHDPATGARSLRESEFSRQFTGVALELVRAEGFRPRVDRTRLGIGQLWTRIDGFWPAFRQILFLSLILQLLALIGPLFLQIAIDNVLPSADSDLLLVLALGFGGVALVSMLTGWVRSLVLIRLGSSLSYQIIVNLFRHLLRLPLPWFERRHVGDIVSRFSSTRAISDLLSQGLIAALVDGVMAFTTCVLMFLYSPVLALLALVAFALVVGLRFGFFAALRQANVSVITANARENSAFIETMRGIATLKAFGEESNRQRLWQQRKADAVNTEIKTGRLNATFNAGEQLVMAAERVLFVYIAVRYAMSGALSVGMIFALQSFRSQFLDAVSRLVQQAINFRLLDMHLNRIADIALSPAEPAARASEGALSLVPKESGPIRIELRNVRFRYTPTDPEVLKGINLVVEPGDLIALVGPSGGGKTTLLKIMMGLLTPSFGEVLIDGIPLATYGVTRLRREIGSVMQEGSLFAGSLAENISLFDPNFDRQRVAAAAEAAHIASEIEAFPMQYDTPVGDMGSTLSGGQKQRLMLARALYREPRGLFLDEPTANLDLRNEESFVHTLLNSEATRVMTAHRPQTMQRARQIYWVVDGAIKPVPRGPLAA